MGTQVKNRVCNDKGWKEITDVEVLNDIEVIPFGTRHCPIKHGRCVEMFQEVLNDNNIAFNNPVGLLNPDKLRYIYTVNISIPGLDEYCFSLGFINYNDQSKSWTGLAGEYTFVCSNQMFTGEVQEFKRKHTTNVLSQLHEKCGGVVEYFKNYRDGRIIKNNRLAEFEFGNRQLGEAVLSMHRSGNFANVMIDKVIKEYDEPSFPEFKDHTALNFQQSCTHVFKEYKNPLQAINACKEIETTLDYICDIKIDA